jgi:hypothetical protein
MEKFKLDITIESCESEEDVYMLRSRVMKCSYPVKKEHILSEIDCLINEYIDIQSSY